MLTKTKIKAYEVSEGDLLYANGLSPCYREVLRIEQDLEVNKVSIFYLIAGNAVEVGYNVDHQFDAIIER